MTQNRPAGKITAEMREERRRRRHRRVIRNRIIFGTVCFLLLLLIVFGITKLVGALLTDDYEKAEVNTLHFNSDGTITVEEIADFSEDGYSTKELKEQVNDMVEEYNTQYGDGALVVDDLTVKKSEVYFRCTYESTEAYQYFSEYGTFCGTIEEALDNGFSFSCIIVPVENGTAGSPIEFDSPYDFSDYKVAIIKENIKVTVPGTIKYISNHSTNLVEGEDNAVVISQADGNNDATEYVYIIYEEDDEK